MIYKLWLKYKLKVYTKRYNALCYTSKSIKEHIESIKNKLEKLK